MKTLRTFPARLFGAFLSFLKSEPQETQDEESPSKSNGLLRLHEFQHRVIVEVFRICIAGFAVFAILLVAVTLYMFSDPNAPMWQALPIGFVGIVLVLALIRTTREFRTYRQIYQDVTSKLHEKIAKSSKAIAKARSSLEKSGEEPLLSNLKPAEHKGWDHKICGNCHKNIELLADICQHCGHDQDTLLTN